MNNLFSKIRSMLFESPITIQEPGSELILNNCEIADKPLPEDKFETVFEQQFLPKLEYSTSQLEAYSKTVEHLIEDDTHPFIYALTKSFNDHRPISFHQI